MREIKFRAWDTKNKEMVNDIWIAPHYGWLVMTDNDAMAERERPERNQWELMQFTGLRDKNGKEIYEGDILEGLGIVEWVASDCRFGMNIFEELKEVEFWELKPSNLEVIGNIYENPELAGRTE